MATDTSAREIVFIDSRVQDVATLLKGMPPGAEVVVLNAGEDGLQQMAAVLGERGDVGAVHVLAHGSEGQLLLGNTVLGNQLDSHSAQLASIGRAMTQDGDLLVYACDVGAGEEGAQFVSTLAQLTGADVAASTDLTGAAALGGNWALEAHEGKIDTKTLEITDYQDVFTLISLNGSDADYSSTTIVKQVTGQNITFSGGASAGGLGIDGTYGTDGLYAYQGPTNEVRLTITAAAGYSFDINSFDVGVMTGSLKIDFTYADGTTDTLTVNSLPNGWQTVLNTSLSKPINDVKQVVFSSGDFGLFQNFDITDVKAVLHPPTVTVNSASLSADTGTSGSDFITKTAAQTISGTLSTALSTGEKVEVSYDNGGNWSDATSYTVGSSSWSTTTALAGSSTFQARVTNADGSSTAYTHSYTLDTTAPTTSFTGVTLSADTGTSITDLVTNTASQIITATLSGAPAGTDIVWGSVDGGSHWIDVTSKVVGTTLTWNGATLGAGSNAIAFKVTDAAGNDSGLSSQNYTLDTTAPTTTMATASFSNDSGTSSSDFITHTAAQDLSGTLSANLAAGESVLVSLDNGGSWATATATVGQDTWSLAGRTLTASDTLRVKVSDTAGNDGVVLSQAYIYDTVAPTTTFNSLALSADTGSSSSDFITKTAAQTITATLSGVLSGGDILYGSLDNGATWTDITSKVSGTALTWNGVTLTASDTLQLRVTDSAGNDGTVRSQAYTLDTDTPATPGTPDLASASDTGVLNADNLTFDTTPTLSGTAENGSTVTLYDGATLLGTVTAGAGGWTYTTGVLAQGVHTITAVSTDTAGNASAASAALTVTIDTTAPDVTSVAVPANGTYYSGDALDFTVNVTEAVVVDTSGGTPRIALVVGATTRYADYVSGSGSSALVFRYTVPSGDVDANGITIGALSVNGGTLRDAAGNSAATTLNSVGSTADVNVDGSNPSITNVSASTADGAYAVGSTVTITADFSTAVDVDTTGGIPTLALDGGGSATYSGGSGSSTLTFVYTVGAGQNSADLDYSSTGALTLNGATIVDAGGSHQPAALTLATPGTAGSLGANKDLVIDTTAPTNTIASATFSTDTGTSATDFITKTAAQTVSGTLVSNLVAGEHVYVSLDNASNWVLAAASAGANTWSLSGQTLAGSGTLQVRVVDDAGNSGTAYTQAYVLDTMAPTVSFSGIALSADTGVAGDLITHTAAQTISATLSGAPAAGDVVYGSLDNGATWTDVTSKVSGTTLTWNGVTLAGSNTLQLRVSDVAGNNGAATSAAYVLDTTAPNTTVASVVFSADTGVSSTDFITKTAAQTLSGTLSANLASGEYVLVSLDNGATWTAATSTVGSNTWSLGGQTLSASDTLQVKVTDTAGNDGAVFGQAYIYDTAATVPTVASLSSLTLAPVLTGVAALAAGETMTITVGGATYDVVPVAGAWSLDLAAAVPASGTLTLALNQRYEVVATVTDLAGNVASDTTAGELLLGTLPVTPDPEPPVTPPVTPPTPGVPDNDGIPPAVEDQAPGIPGPGGTPAVQGDGNGDGIKDSEQAGVASIGFVLSPTGESNPGSAVPTFTTLVASSLDGKVSGDPSNSRITSLEQKDAPDHLPEGMQMPIGLVSFTIELGAGKTGENFSLYVDPALEANGYWKQDNTGTWVNIASEPYGGKMVMEGGRLRLDFHIEDGGQFDADGKVDGIITDPGAPGHMPLSIMGMAPDVGPGFWF